MPSEALAKEGAMRPKKAISELQIAITYYTKYLRLRLLFDKEVFRLLLAYYFLQVVVTLHLLQ